MFYFLYNIVKMIKLQRWKTDQWLPGGRDGWRRYDYKKVP